MQTINDSNSDFVIGVVGGMGSYATLSFFKRYLIRFPAEKEWDRPRIIIDNRCTMPSRVRALLYKEKYEDVINQITNSIESLIHFGGKNTNVVLACNTSHVFLNQILIQKPELKKNIIHLIEETGMYLYKKNIKEVYLIATEGTIESKIYQETLAKYEINVDSPESEIFPKLRYFIELVKQDKVNDYNFKGFECFLRNLNKKNIILGCTEFSSFAWYKPILQSENINLIDPLEIVLDILYKKWFDKING